MEPARLSEFKFDLRTEEVIDQVLGCFGIGRALDERDRVRNDQGSGGSFSLIEKADLDRQILRFRRAGVVGIGQAERKVAGGDEVAHRGITVYKTHAPARQRGEEPARLLWPPARIERGGVSGRRAEQRIGDADLTGWPLVGGEVEQSSGPFAGLQPVGIDDQNARPSAERSPVLRLTGR